MTTSRIIIESEYAPPSVNNLFVNAGRKRVKSKGYRDWIEACGWELKAQARGQHIPGDYEMILSIDPRKVRKGRDLSNFVKPVEDLLVAHHLVEDDSRCRHLAVMFDACVKTIRIELLPARAA